MSYRGWAKGSIVSEIGTYSMWLLRVGSAIVNFTYICRSNLRILNGYYTNSIIRIEKVYTYAIHKDFRLGRTTSNAR